MERESWTNFSIIRSAKEAIFVKPNVLTYMLPSASIQTPLEKKKSGQGRASFCGFGHHSALNASCGSEGSTLWLVGRVRLKGVGVFK